MGPNLGLVWEHTQISQSCPTRMKLRPILVAGMGRCGVGVMGRNSAVALQLSQRLVPNELHPLVTLLVVDGGEQLEMFDLHGPVNVDGA